MKSIKSFKYVNEKGFEKFLDAYGYKSSDVVGFRIFDKHQCNGNILKHYSIYFDDGERIYFTEVYFKNFNEYKRSLLGFNGNKLLSWWENANVKAYKVCNEVISCW